MITTIALMVLVACKESNGVENQYSCIDGIKWYSIGQHDNSVETCD